MLVPHQTLSSSIPHNTRPDRSPIWLVQLLLVLACLFAGMMGLNYWIDPLQFYRKAAYPPHFQAQQRYQNPGLAKNFDYDAIIIGSSMVENFIPTAIGSKTGAKVMKLAVSGTTAREAYLTADLALRSGKVKQVLWGLDFFQFSGDPDRVRTDFGPFPFYLYDENWANDYQYLLSNDTTKASLKILLDKALGHKRQSDLDLLYNWHREARYGRENVVERWKLERGNAKYFEGSYELPTIQRSLDQNILALVMRYPTVTFTFYYPPYSILYQQLMYAQRRDAFNAQLMSKQYFVNKVSSLPNARVHDFRKSSLYPVLNSP